MLFVIKLSYNKAIIPNSSYEYLNLLLFRAIFFFKKLNNLFHFKFMPLIVLFNLCLILLL